MNFKRYQIKLLFNSDAIIMNKGLWFSGERGEGEYRRYSKRSGSWQPFEISTWRNDQKHGKYKLFSFDGKPKVDGWFSKGMRHGEYKIWNKVGELVHHSIYNKGKEIEDLK